MARPPAKSKAALKRAQKAAAGWTKTNGGTRTDHERGRIPDYVPEYCEIAYRMCAGEDPATDQQLADEFGVQRRTVYEWRQRYPDFAAACKLGKEQADDRMERSLYHRGVGYDYDSEEIKVIEGAVVRVPVRIHVPPDTACMMKWLHNRRPEKWRDIKAVELTGQDGGPVQVKEISDLELARRVLFDLEQQEREGAKDP